MSTTPEGLLFSVDNYVLTAINTRPLSELSPKKELSENPEPSDILLPSWSQNAYPQLAFIPCDIRWDDPLLKRLAYGYRDIPIVTNGNRYLLNQDVRTRWFRLETALMIVGKLLIEKSGRAFPLDFSFFPPPSTFGYLRTHKSQKIARNCSMNSIKAFIPLMAMSSMGIALISPRDWTSEVPTWMSHLLKAGIHPEWVEMLRRSPVGDFTLPNQYSPRCGVIVDTTTCQYNDLVLAFIAVGIPVWLSWTKFTPVWPRLWPLKVPDRLKHWFPTPNDMELAVTLACEAEGDALTAECDAESERQRNEAMLFQMAEEHAGLSCEQTGYDTQYDNHFDSTIPGEQTEYDDMQYEDRLHHDDQRSQYYPEVETRYEVTPHASRSDQPQSVPRFPKLPPHSRQRTGETWQEYFARMETRDAKKAENETQSDKNGRLNRERAVWSKGGLGKKGARVFQWQLVDSFWIRVPLTRRVVEDIWHRFPNAHKRFNSFDNEWDICPMLAPDLDSEIDSDSEDEAYEGVDMSKQLRSLSPTSSPELAVLPKPTYTSSRAHSQLQTDPGTGHPRVQARSAILVRDIQPAVPQTVSWTNDVVQALDGFMGFGRRLTNEPCSMEETIYFQYGFDWYSEDAPPISPEVWERFGGMVLQDKISRLTSGMEGHVIAFFESLLNGPWDGMAWDLSRNHPFPLRDKVNVKISITREIPGAYIIRPAEAVNTSIEWIILVDNPATVLRCIRLDTSDLKDIAQHLLDNGLRFNTIAPIPPHSSLPPPFFLPPAPFFGLGVRPPRYQPDAADFAAYQVALEHFLTTSPRARAALLQGGLIWRIATEFLGLNHVLVGPSERASSHGERTTFPDGRVFCDDSLSEEELDLICGVYKVYTGIGTQCTHLSWWPKPQTWNKSSHNVGYWTVFAEQWFQKRIELIRNHMLECKSSSTWYSSLKVSGKGARSVRVAEKYVDASREFLDNHDFE